MVDSGRFSQLIFHPFQDGIPVDVTSTFSSSRLPQYLRLTRVALPVVLISDATSWHRFCEDVDFFESELTDAADLLRVDVEPGDDPLNQLSELIVNNFDALSKIIIQATDRLLITALQSFQSRQAYQLQLRNLMRGIDLLVFVCLELLVSTQRMIDPSRPSVLSTVSTVCLILSEVSQRVSSLSMHSSQCMASLCEFSSDHTNDVTTPLINHLLEIQTCVACCCFYIASLCSESIQFDSMADDWSNEQISKLGPSAPMMLESVRSTFVILFQVELIPSKYLPHFLSAVVSLAMVLSLSVVVHQRICTILSSWGNVSIAD